MKRWTKLSDALRAGRGAVCEPPLKRRAKLSNLGSGFILRLEDERYQKAEEDGGGDAGGGGGYAAREGAEHAALGDGLAHALRQRIAEAGQRHAGPRPGPVGQRLVHANCAQNDPGHDVAGQYSRRGEPRLVYEQLPDDAEGPADEEGLQA